MIGDIVIGSAKGDVKLTPISLVPGAVDETHPKVQNIVRFLLTVDDDANPSNGIQITEAVRNAAIGQSIDFDLFDLDPNDPTVPNIIAELTAHTSAGIRTIVDADTASLHLLGSLLSELEGDYASNFTMSFTGVTGSINGSLSLTFSADGAVVGAYCIIGDNELTTLTGSVEVSGEFSVGDGHGTIFNGEVSPDNSISGNGIVSLGTSTATGQIQGAPGNVLADASVCNDQSGNVLTGIFPDDDNPPSGTISISGVDTAVIGAVFTPTVDDQSFVSGSTKFAILDTWRDSNIELGVRVHNMLANFVGDTPAQVLYSSSVLVLQSTQNGDELVDTQVFSYVADCDETACDSITFDTMLNVVTFNNFTILPDHLDDSNNATSAIVLNGSVNISTFTVQ